ncbi:MAG: hypothetical protein ACRC2R_10575 [Xenococcaceae cyanobacterium]
MITPSVRLKMLLRWSIDKELTFAHIIKHFRMQTLTVHLLLLRIWQSRSHE